MSTYGYLAHHGIKGQKWGIRRYENPDGTLTEAGKERYGYKKYKQLEKERTGWATAGAIAAISLIPISLLTVGATAGGSIPIGIGGSLAIAAVSGAVDKLYDKRLNEIKEKNPGIKKIIKKENERKIKYAKSYDSKEWDKLEKDLNSGKINIKQYDEKSSKLHEKIKNQRKIDSNKLKQEFYSDDAKKDFLDQMKKDFGSPKEALKSGGEDYVNSLIDEYIDYEDRGYKLTKEDRNQIYESYKDLFWKQK